MTFAKVHKYVTYLIAGMGMYALTLGGNFSVPAMVLMAIGFFASWTAEAPMIQRPNYGRNWTYAVIAFFVVQTARAFLRAPSILELALEYVGFLQVSRLFNRRTSKDYQQIAVLSFLHLIAATVLTTSVVYGLIFIGFLIATPWMLTVSQLRREVEDFHVKDPTQSDAILNEKEIVGSRFLLTTALLTLPIFFVTLGLFLIFPRVGLGVISVGGVTGQSTTGFGKNVTLGNFGTIREDPTVVLRVTIPKAAGGPKGRGGALRLRGTSFDEYDGKTWLRTDSGSWILRSGFNAFSLVRYPDRQKDLEYKIVLDHLDETVIFLPEGTVALGIPPRVTGARERPRKVHAAQGFEFRYEDQGDQGLTYYAYVSKNPKEWRKGELKERHREWLTETPPSTARVVELAKQVVGNAKTDKEKAAKILHYLRDSGKFRYTLTQPNTEGKDPLTVFLFSAKAGHCEYFSTAMAIMLRGVGVPTRNVSGFYGGSYNQYGQYYALRRSDAHSWVEAWIGDRWVTLDPTPSGRNEMGLNTGVLSSVRDFMDAVRTRWARQIVGYDIRTQTEGLRKFFQWARGVRKSFGDGAKDTTTERGAGSSPSSWTSYAPPALAILSVLGVLAVVWWRRRRAQLGLAGIEPRSHSAVRLYRALEDILDRRGRPRPRAVTPLEHAQALTAEGFEGAGAVAAITERYLAARFGSAWLTDDEERHYRGLLAEVRAGKTAPTPTEGQRAA